MTWDEHYCKQSNEDNIARVKEIANFLIGRCQGSCPMTETELDELGVGVTADASAAFDEIVFICATCGRYCSIDELSTDSGDTICTECAEDATNDTRTNRP